MRRQARMALGVDVSPTRVCMALVRRESRRLVLVRAAKAVLPAGTIQDGRIENPPALIKVMAGLSRRCKGQHARAAVSLAGSSVRMQILELPTPLPANVGAFIQNEIKHSVTLAADRLVSDHCHLASKGGPRLLAAAADGGRVLPLVEACERAWLGLDIVEPSLLATIRGLSAKTIGGQSDRNVLLAVLRETWLDLCIFKAGRLDFIRSRDMADVWSDPEALCKRLAEEIRAIVQYYDSEAADTPAQWQMMVLQDDGAALPDDALSRLKSLGFRAEMAITTADQVGSALGVECDNPAVLAEASPSAVGLALRLLGEEDGTPQVNLLPPQITQRRVVRRQALITAVCAAVVLLVTALVVMGLIVRTERLRGNIIDKQKAHSLKETVALVTEQNYLDARIQQITKARERLDVVCKTQCQIDWPGLLADVRSATPSSVFITRLIGRQSEKSDLVIDGFSFNYGAVNLFTSRLNQSRHMSSATVVKSSQEEAEGRMYFVYQIRCTLEAKTGS